MKRLIVETQKDIWKKCRNYKQRTEKDRNKNANKCCTRNKYRNNFDGKYGSMFKQQKT
jgi:hypothetical protein